METKHTPGPWHIAADGKIYGADEFTVADALSAGNVVEERRVNARLIAAAPELLGALRMVCDSGIAIAEPIERAMLDALAKATA